jgi:hypothetical protein
MRASEIEGFARYLAASLGVDGADAGVQLRAPGDVL